MKFYHSDYFLVAYTKTHTYRCHDRFIVGPTWKYNSEKSFDVRERVKTTEVHSILFMDPVRVYRVLGLNYIFSSLVASFPDHTRVRDLLRAGKPIEFCWWQINPQGTIALSSPPPTPYPSLWHTTTQFIRSSVYSNFGERRNSVSWNTPCVGNELECRCVDCFEFK